MIENESLSNSYGEIYHLIVNNILDVVGELDLNGIFTYVNPYIYDELGYQVYELIGREIYDIVHPDDIKEITKVLLRSTKHIRFIPEIRLKNDNNQFIWYEIKAIRIEDYNRQRKILITLKNISKVKTLEEKLRQKEEEYQKITNSIPEIQFWKVLSPRKYKNAIHTTSEILRVIIDNISQCVFWKDSNFKYLGCNHTFAEFIGIKHPESIIGKTDEELLSNKEKIQQIRECENKVIQSGKPIYHTNDSWNTDEGEEIWLDITRVPLIDSDEKLIGIVTSFEEITDRKIAEENLKKSVKKYKNLSIELETIMDIIPGMIFVKDKEDVITRGNQYFADSLELDKEEIIGKSTFDLFPKAQATAFRNDDLDVLTSGKPKLNIEEIADFPSGKISAITSKVPYYNENEEIEGIIGLAIDITERKILEQKLKESEEKYRAIFEKGPDSIFLVDIETGEIIDFNEKTHLKLGYSHEEFSRLKISDFEVVESAEDIKERIKKIVNKGSDIFETKQITKDGKILDILIHSNIVNIGGKKYIQSICHDITERKKIEIDLERANFELPQILNAIVPLRMIDKDFNIIQVNDRYTELLKIEKDEIINKKCYDIFKETYCNTSECTLKQILQGKEFYRHEIEMELKDGSENTFIQTSYPYRDFEGEIVGIIQNFTDITERKKSEEIILASERWLKSLIEAIPIGISISNPEGEISEINTKAYKIFGYGSKEEFLKLPAIAHYYNSKDREKYFELLDSGLVKDFEVQFKRKNGTLFWGSSTAIAQRIGDHTTLINTFQDITDRRKTEEEVADLAKFPEENPNPVLRVSREFVLYANQSGQDILNIKIGNRIPIILREIINKSFEEEVTQILEVELNNHIYSLFVTPIKGTNYINIYGMDITEGKRAEKTISDLAKFPSENPNPVLRLTKEKVIYTNKEGEILFNIKKGSEVPAVLQESVIKALDTNKTISTEVALNSRIFSLDITPISEEGYVNVYGMDITERKKKEEEIRLQSEIIENMSEGVYLIKLDDGTIVYTNPAFEEMFGYEPNEMIGKNVSIVNAPTDKTPEETRNEIMAILSETGEWHGEVLNIKKDGISFWCYANVSLFDHPEYGRVIVSVHTDITERKKAEQALKESEEKFREIAEQSLIGIQILQDNQTKYVNQQWANISGYSVEEIMNWDFDEHLKFIHPDNREFVRQQLIKKQEGDKDVINRYQAKCIKKTGETIWVEIFAKTINYEGKFADFVMLVDITEKKELDEIKSNLLTRFSHEFKTPLISIKGFTDLLLTEYAEIIDEKAISFLNKIKDGGNRLKSLINTFIEGTQLDMDLIELDLKQENLSKLVMSSLERMEGVIKMREHSVDLNIHDELKVVIDKERIETVFTNLLINSINYTPKGGNISIKSKIKGNSIIVSVKDNGIGLDEDEINQLFEPFGKIERYGEGWEIVTEGMGMGLYIAKEIIELHGGQIWTESEGRGKGSVFSFSLPLVKK